MGRFVYNGTTKAEIEDRTLLHLQLVITAKLRRGEAFTFSWRDDPSYGEGRTTVWISAAARLVYEFYGSRRPDVNRAWTEALAYTASTATGLYVVPEPPSTSAAANTHAIDVVDA